MQNVVIEKTTHQVKSDFITLKEVVEYGYLFNIPIYQRLYVWGEDQIKTLLEDLNKGFNDNIAHYYLGGIIVSQNQAGRFDLIDGQQRFTTLWLIGNVIKNSLLQFNYHSEANKEVPRLGFSIRDYANDFFSNPDNFKNISKYESENIKELEPVKIALQTIERFIKDNDFDETRKKSFSDFIMTKVRLMITEMPQNTDENKLFEALNNRGVQLQHHEILKAKILKFITNDEERSKYAKLWDACSIMDEYIEKNIKDTAGLKWKDLTFQPEEDEKSVDLPPDILNKINSVKKTKNLHLFCILKNENNENSEGKENKNDDEIVYDSGKVESIISFPMLLLHVLRIYQFDKNQLQTLSVDEIAPVDEKKLLQIFENKFIDKYFQKVSIEESEKNEKFAKNEETAKKFFDLLLEIRVKFDKHIIKWIIKENNLKIHGIKKLYLNKDALQRKESERNDGFALLQSMLYHSQQIITHYWLTPLLNKLRSCDSSDELYKYLQQVDNAMFCTGNEDVLSQRSWNFLKQDVSAIIPKIQSLEIEDCKGTDYPSYVFYKLDFVLWYLRDYIFEQKQLKETRKEDWDNYRMTAKNSVEHISPQNRKETDINLVWNDDDTPESKKKKLDDFGNLVLLTSSMNSEYSNNIFTTKRSEFLAKANNKRLDSLKSALIFENTSWSRELCETHRNEVIDYLIKYFIETSGNKNNLI